MRTLNGQPIRERGKNHFRPSRKEQKETHATTATALIGELAYRYECTEGVSETVEEHLIPRRSMSHSQLLRVLPQRIETVPNDVIVRDPKTLHVIDVIKHNRLVYKSDKTLLRMGRPVKEIHDENFKRLTSKSKRIKSEPYAGPVVIESTPLDPKLGIE